MACEEGDRRLWGLIDDPECCGFDDFGSFNQIDVTPIVILEDDLIARHQLIEVPEHLVFAGAMSSDDHIAKLTGSSGAGPVAGAEIEGRESNPFVHRCIDFDGRNLNR